MRGSACTTALKLGFYAVTAYVALALVFAGGALAQLLVDLELVLAVDVSLSMDLDEQRLQRDGYITAFRDGEVQKAITSGPHGRIAVTYMEWAGPSVQNVVVPWTIIDGSAAAHALADKLEAQPISRARMTSISQGLVFAAQLFDSSGVKGIRRVIDVSGDGPNNAGPLVTLVRDQVVAQGIAINGLPILLKKPASFFDIADLDVYYRECVIGGAGAFMIPVRERFEFKTATRRKLLLEIADGDRPALLIPAQLREPISGGDCTVGEQQWRRYLDTGPN
jgi:Protein of unknown function (DUF1194)